MEGRITIVTERHTVLNDCVVITSLQLFVMRFCISPHSSTWTRHSFALTTILEDSASPHLGGWKSTSPSPSTQWMPQPWVSI